MNCDIAWWERPKNAAILVGVIATLVAALSGWLGWSIGSTPPAPIVVQFQQPLTVKVLP